MQWYVIHTKFRQEEHALLNLKRQGYECFLPMLAVEQMRQKALRVIEQPLFPRYLFIQLDVHGSGKSWGPIRSTKGVSRLVMFGSEPAWLDDGIVAALRARIAAASRDAEPEDATSAESYQQARGADAGVSDYRRQSVGEDG